MNSPIINKEKDIPRIPSIKHHIYLEWKKKLILSFM